MKLNKEDEHFYQNSLQSGFYNSFVGLSFELVCLEHIKQIKYALGISGVLARNALGFVLKIRKMG